MDEVIKMIKDAIELIDSDPEAAKKAFYEVITVLQQK